MLCGFQYGCPALCGLAPIVVLRSFGDRVKTIVVSVSLSPSPGRIQPWPRIKLVTPLFFSKLPLLPAALLQVILIETYYREDRANSRTEIVSVPITSAPRAGTPFGSILHYLTRLLPSLVRPFPRVVVPYRVMAGSPLMGPCRVM